MLGMKAHLTAERHVLHVLQVNTRFQSITQCVCHVMPIVVTAITRLRGLAKRVIVALIMVSRAYLVHRADIRPKLETLCVFHALRTEPSATEHLLGLAVQVTEATILE